MTSATFRQYALQLPEATEGSHFQKTSFLVGGKIFATLQEAHQRAVLKLSLQDQARFCAVAGAAFFPVPNAWGAKGWTTIQLENAEAKAVRDALETAWYTVAPARLKRQLNQPGP